MSAPAHKLSTRPLSAPLPRAVPFATGNDGRVYLHAGEWYCAAVPTVISTVLGSCVAVCLWDDQRLMGGINHFMLPGGGAPGNARFADPAIDALVAGMRELGARDMVAKLFGGAAVLPWRAGQVTVGALNVMAAEAGLRRHAIPAVSSHLGGTNGVAIRFDTGSGEVLLRQVLPAGDTDV